MAFKGNQGGLSYKGGLKKLIIYTRKFFFLYCRLLININLQCKMICAKSIAYIIYNNF